jgi:predicted alpha-1,2-mannosidase
LPEGFHLFGTLTLLLALATPAPVTLVDPFIGTSGTKIGGPIDTFPGADVPFGMVQWSPDTPSQNAGGGYEYTDKGITGFSLTHLSGPGCNVFGDFGILPTIGDVKDPDNAKQPFKHDGETATPGSYSVWLGSPPIHTELTVTARTGIGRFTFPATQQANVLFNAGSNQAGVTAANVTVDSPTEISGSATSGFFCGMADSYTVYFVARFDRPFASYGTWKDYAVTAHSKSTGGPQSGAYVTFDATNARTITLKVGLSFVSVAGARANLDAENPGWDFGGVAAAAAASWNGYLSRVTITGGTDDQQRMFYTALYHTLLHPNVESDADGRYPGFDGRIHRARPHHQEYANFSDWDIYRTEVPLLALLAPGETSDMMQSLVDAARQENGWLPRWALVNGPSSVMGGDSIDPVIAGAYAFGARDFDALAALRAMIKGASTTGGPPGQGWYIPRWELDDDYMHRGFVVNTHTTSVAPVPNGASETLEYALDDFSIARLAQSLAQPAFYQRFMRRASNWSTIFNTATGEMSGRDPAGAFMNAPITENGQSGFQEGNAAQYTWMVPQDLHDLAEGMGGNAAAITKLDTFFTQLNADQDKPYAWLGNEVSLGSPWVYLSLGEPWRTQQIVREAITTLFTPAPDGLPGNDDLGTMSAWYVWSAMGLYPQNPAVRALDVGSPLFTSVVLHSPANGPTIDIEAPSASATTPYVQALRVNGGPTQNAWLELPMHGTLRLDFDLAAQPDKQWGSAPWNAPQSYAAAPLHFDPASTVRIVAPDVSVTAGGHVATAIVLDNTDGSKEQDLRWSAAIPAGLHVSTADGASGVAAGAKFAIPLDISVDASMPGGYYGIAIGGTAANGALLQRQTLAVRVDGATPHAIAWAQNRFGNTVVPVDLVTGVVGPAIAAGEEPRDAVLSDGRLYVTNRGSGSVTVIDTATQRVLATIKTGNGPNGIALGPDGNTAWIADADDNTIQAIDLHRFSVGAPVGVGVSPRAIAIAPDGKTLFVTNSGSNTVTPVDVATHTAQASITVGGRPFGIAIAPDGKTLYVVDNADNDVTPIDVATRQPLRAIPVGVSPMMIAVAPNGSLAYVSNYANSTITPIDLATRTAKAPIVVGGAPYGIAFARDGKTAVVVARRDNSCVTVDVASGRAGPPIWLGNGPYTIALP